LEVVEQIRGRLRGRSSVGWESITTAPWPEPRPYDEKAVERGEVIIRTIAAIRRAKSEAGMPLSAELPAVDIHAPRKYAEILRRGIDDIAGTLRIREVRISEGGRGEREVPEYPEITFTLLRA